MMCELVWTQHCERKLCEICNRKVVKYVLLGNWGWYIWYNFWFGYWVKVGLCCSICWKRHNNNKTMRIWEIWEIDLYPTCNCNIHKRRYFYNKMSEIIWKIKGLHNLINVSAPLHTALDFFLSSHQMAGNFQYSNFGSESLLEDWPALPLIWSTLWASQMGLPHLLSPCLLVLSALRSNYKTMPGQTLQPFLWVASHFCSLFIHHFASWS